MDHFLPSHFSSTILYPGGQSEQLYPRPNTASSSAFISTQVLPKAHGVAAQPSVSFSQSRPVNNHAKINKFNVYKF